MYGSLHNAHKCACTIIILNFHDLNDICCRLTLHHVSVLAMYRLSLILNICQLATHAHFNKGIYTISKLSKHRIFVFLVVSTYIFLSHIQRKLKVHTIVYLAQPQIWLKTHQIMNAFIANTLQTVFEDKSWPQSHHTLVYSYIPIIHLFFIPIIHMYIATYQWRHVDHQQP